MKHMAWSSLWIRSGTIYVQAESWKGNWLPRNELKNISTPFKENITNLDIFDREPKLQISHPGRICNNLKNEGAKEIMVYYRRHIGNCQKENLNQERRRSFKAKLWIPQCYAWSQGPILQQHLQRYSNNNIMGILWEGQPNINLT